MFKPTKPPFRKYKNKVFLQAASVSSLIYQIGENDNLRMPSKKVLLATITTPEFEEKVEHLKICLVKYTKMTGHGRGIAAIQVGIPETFFVYYKTLDRKEIGVVINPKITKRSKSLLMYPEICMSANPIIVPLKRPSWIEFDYYDEFGKKMKWKTKDKDKYGKMMNRIFQHETDHLQGIINVDLVESPKELILESDPEFYKTVKFEKVE